MAKKKNEFCYGFVYTSGKPCCLKADGSRDYEKLVTLLRAAENWDHEAQMRIFEQYSGVWQPMCSQSEEVMYRLAMDYEDFQQESFKCFLVSLKNFRDSDPENFKQFFLTNLKNRIINLLKNIEKQLVGHKILKSKKELEESGDANNYRYSTCCSLQETYPEGNLKYDIPDTDAKNEYFQDYYPRIKKLLTEREYEIVIDCYDRGISLKEKAKELGISYIWIKKINANIKEKLKVLRN